MRPEIGIDETDGMIKTGSTDISFVKPKSRAKKKAAILENQLSLFDFLELTA